MFSNNYCLCDECRNSFHLRFKTFKFDSYKVRYLYDYDQWIKENLFKLKGCYDYELAPVFLEALTPILKMMYSGYVLVPAPSFIEDDEIRGFNHVEEIFKSLKFKAEKAIIKKYHFKQSDQSFENRHKIEDVLDVDPKLHFNLYGKKILIVDDVFTTGSTVRTMINLLKPFHPKRIEVLVMSKVINTNS